ncbi:hypothetical protein DQ384_39995 [Sphaerisporangium album]|uniref:Uncharacterized protein n=1 Tax=Sphaerisporangium album TaxID=509200 RepID=A0A367EFN8_9ACTN|nr:hypothetical protein DQ384_39995 [Sphaerisporangium album]
MRGRAAQRPQFHGVGVDLGLGAAGALPGVLSLGGERGDLLAVGRGFSPTREVLRYDRAGARGRRTGGLVQTFPVMDSELFSNGALNDYLQQRLDAAVKAAGQIPAQQIRFSPAAVIEHLVSEYAVQPAQVDFTAMTRTDISEARISWQSGYYAEQVPGQQFSVIVPFTGEPELFRRQASTRHLNSPPRASIRDDALVFYVQAPRLTPELVDQQVASMREELTQRLRWAENDVQQWEGRLRLEVSRAVRERKKLLDHAEALSSALNIPLAPAPPDRQIHVPFTRKQLRIEPAAPAPGRDDPRLAEDMYEDVVRTISGMSRAAERLPATALHLGEEGFRDLLLFVLNANYEGAVRGEVFNFSGKTDILLSWKDRNVFIGECKMWGGQKKFVDAIDQLLGYTAWRDTKAALILFIQGGNPTEIIKKADEAIRSHAAFCSAGSTTEPELRQNYLMKAPQDPQRFVTMAFLPVVIPAK